MTALSYLPALLLPLAVQVARIPVAWLFVAAAVGFAVPPLAQTAGAAHTAGGADALFRDLNFVASRAPGDTALAALFATLAAVQSARTRLDREDPFATALLFWIPLLAAIAARLIVTVMLPAATAAGYYGGSATALRLWGLATNACLLIAATAAAALAVLMVLAPLRRRATGRRTGDR